jgi:predicted transposase YbfD/YdcC
MIEEYFGDLKDKRKKRGKRHKLIDIITIALCGVICGADDWVSVEAFGNAKEEWLRTFLEMPHGVPSHDTFGTVFGWIEPEEFQQRFLAWVQGVVRVTEAEVIGIDGKRMRGSKEKHKGKRAIEIVSAWATENEMVLGQVKVAEDSNEITAIPKLLKLLEIKGCIVTIDAMGCQKGIAAEIIEQNADYILGLEENHAHLYTDVEIMFAELEKVNFSQRVYPHTYAKTTNKGHGRIEIRECWVIHDEDIIQHLRTAKQWEDLRAIIQIKAQRKMEDKHTTHTRYFISSLDKDASYLLNAIRSHWQIENQLHWVLDVAFREDHHRVRTGHQPENFAVLRHIALNLLKRETSRKLSIKNKRLTCALDHQYFLKVLHG